ncbi:Stk1 family PASTA domain-containing Ser/Thr kinase [uncultured Gemmiger sp.]|uniref:Stk1 family PASTA domain-containing Ser/Thr kinase n=1 Tax=uncultured Gemmiger sp. TaxID=1623490 RepID=UPI0025DA2E0E|nr:Stk1 family PASTA domain-containing Ser/Thr kinase [uncultured Gemmiger sp.]
MDNLIGKKLDGRYLIEGLIGVGGMANVYRGRDTQSGNEVAVKILKPELMDNEELVRRFKNESKAISILNHPNIVKVYDVSVTDKMQYIVMEYVDGITLKEYLKQRGGALTWKETVHFATQILAALDHAHNKGIIHRDVKPQNIMLLADGSIKMMDFGIARFSRAQSQTVSDKAIGSVHYISPEQAKGDRTDARTDIYSVGVMLYEMLSGQLPFDGNGAVSIAIMQISEKPRPLAEIAPNVPEGLRQITEKAMNKDPNDRYQSAREMLEAIEAFKHNPSIKFEYEYMTTDAPAKTINKIVTDSKSRSHIRTGDARRAGQPTNHGKKGKRRKNKKDKPFSVVPIFFGMAVAFVIGAFILVYLIFANSTNPLFSNRADVQLIDFVGMTEDEFRTSEYYSKLTPNWVYEHNSSYPAGEIYQQNPKAGRTVKEGQTITLHVSQGTLWVTIPDDLIGMEKAAAEDEIKSLGVNNVVSSFVIDDSVASGTVVRTDPEIGQQVEGDATVTLYIAQASIQDTVQLTSTVGLTVEDAQSALGRLNVTPQVIEQSSDQPVGTVLSMYPAAGTEVRIGSRVLLYVSSGVPEVVATPEPVLNGDPNTKVKEWDEDLGNGNWEHRYQTGDGKVYRDDGTFLYQG